jgi:GlpG protein
MNSVSIFKSTNQQNVHTLAGILKQHGIDTTVNKMNGLFELEVDPEKQEAAKAIIKRNIKTHAKNTKIFKQSSSFFTDNPVTASLILITIIVFTLTSFGRDLNQVSNLFFTEVHQLRSIKDNQLIEVAQYSKEAPEIGKGQIWRVLTPSFIHFNLIHLILITAFLFHFGKVIEQTSGRLYLASLVLSSAIIGNTIQYKFSSPYFGGLTPIVMSLYGFLLIRSYHDLNYANKIPPATHIFIFFLLLLT